MGNIIKTNGSFKKELKAKFPIPINNKLLKNIIN